MVFQSQFMDELHARCDIAEVVREYVPLTRRGGHLSGKCPLCCGRCDTLTVSPERQTFYCFCCGKHGGVVGFVMAVESLTLAEAVCRLARQAGMELPEARDCMDPAQLRARRLNCFREAALFYAERSPDGWDGLVTAMAERGYSGEELLEAGLAVKGQGGRIYDRLRDRSWEVRPVTDPKGQVIGILALHEAGDAEPLTVL